MIDIQDYTYITATQNADLKHIVCLEAILTSELVYSH